MEPSDGCRLWEHDVTPAGYGRLRINGTSEVRLSTITCAAWHGPRPTGMMALHSCRNRNCWAGEHLRWGTAQENQDDRIKDGTTLSGNKHPSARLTSDQVLDIRLRYAKGVSMYALAKEFGCTLPNISNIVHRRTWKHIG
jgi:hypothetical protein